MKPHAIRIFVTAAISALALAGAVVAAEPLLEGLEERRGVHPGSRLGERGQTGRESTLENPYGPAPLPHQAASRKVLRDVPYGIDAKQRMDVYLPTPTPGAGPAPVIFMVHGGAWRIGDKRMSHVVSNKTARWLPKGIAFVSINHRLLPEADPLDQVHDVAQALAFAQTRAAGWGADPMQFVLMGHSAGAHLIALLASLPSLGDEAGTKPWLGTVVLDTAALDVAQIMQRKHYKLYDPAFGTDPAFWKAVSPSQQLHAGAKPFLVVCSGRRDESCEQARGFSARGESLGVRMQVLSQDLSHGEINTQLGLPGSYTQSVEAFMASLSPALATRLR